jgi:hypothetical protein
MAQSLGPTEPKWGRLAPPPRPAGQVLVPFQFLLYQRVKERRWMGYPMAKVGGGQPRVWPASQGLESYHLKSMVELTHSAYKYPHAPSAR